MLYSTSHQLQAVSLLYFSDRTGAASTLTTLIEREHVQQAVVLALAKTLLQQKDARFNFDSIRHLTPTEFIKLYESESGSGSSARSPAAMEMQTLESLGISELPGCEISIRAASNGPLLPKDERAAIDAINQQAQIDQLEQLAASVKPAEVASAASHNPELAAEVLATTFVMNELNQVSSWGSACLWALAENSQNTAVNVIACLSLLLDKIDIVEPAALAAFISHSIQQIIAIEVSFICVG
jgi:hypothetical protein